MKLILILGLFWFINCVFSQHENVCHRFKNAGEAAVLVETKKFSTARLWMEALLCAIRVDYAKPVVHARNSFHLSLVLWDAWCAYDIDQAGQCQFTTPFSMDASADAFLPADWLKKRPTVAAADIATHRARLASLPESVRQAAQREAMTHAAYRLMMHRFQDRLASSSAASLAKFRSLYLALQSPADALSVEDVQRLAQVAAAGRAPALPATTGGGGGGGGDQLQAVAVVAQARQFGLRVGQNTLTVAQHDGANELDGYNYPAGYYTEQNPRLNVYARGDRSIKDPDRWQRLDLGSFTDQSNTVYAEYPPFLGPHWGHVNPFALDPARDAAGPEKPGVWLDPGPPPRIAGGQFAQYRSNFTAVLQFSSQLDPHDGVVWDTSPASRGRSTLGRNDGRGHRINPVTGEPYTMQWVPRGDYTRVLAEFWADGPDSETPPGHWNSMFNYVMSQPSFRRRWLGVGPELSALDFDVRAYLALNGALHDSAVAAWGIKGHYDYVRPISAIRWMSDQGQSTDRSKPRYSDRGLPLVPGLVELATAETLAVNGKHASVVPSALRSSDQWIKDQLVNQIVVKTWLGGSAFSERRLNNDVVHGVGWMLAGDWWSYQSSSFVTPPFAGYVSGHSTFSRAAAAVIAWVTGSEYFPGGMGKFAVAQDQFLDFERGPSVSFQLQWARYADASDETSLSRIWGGIHPPVDDLPGRRIGHQCAQRAIQRMQRLLRNGTQTGHRARFRLVAAAAASPSSVQQLQTEYVPAIYQAVSAALNWPSQLQSADANPDFQVKPMTYVNQRTSATVPGLELRVFWAGALPAADLLDVVKSVTDQQQQQQQQQQSADVWTDVRTMPTFEYAEDEFVGLCAGGDGDGNGSDGSSSSSSSSSSGSGSGGADWWKLVVASPVPAAARSCGGPGERQDPVVSAPPPPPPPTEPSPPTPVACEPANCGPNGRCERKTAADPATCSCDYNWRHDAEAGCVRCSVAAIQSGVPDCLRQPPVELNAPWLVFSLMLLAVVAVISPGFYCFYRWRDRRRAAKKDATALVPPTEFKHLSGQHHHHHHHHHHHGSGMHGGSGIHGSGMHGSGMHGSSVHGSSVHGGGMHGSGVHGSGVHGEHHSYRSSHDVARTAEDSVPSPRLRSHSVGGSKIHHHHHHHSSMTAATLAADGSLAPPPPDSRNRTLSWSSGMTTVQSGGSSSPPPPPPSAPSPAAAATSKHSSPHSHHSTTTGAAGSPPTTTSKTASTAAAEFGPSTSPEIMPRPGGGGGGGGSRRAASSTQDRVRRQSHSRRR